MAQFLRSTGRWTVTTVLAASLLVSNLPLAFAGPGDTNSTNYGENVAGGTYYNTAGDRTTFSNANGLTVRSGTTVRGLEVDASGNLTNNGGHLHFSAPNGVIRVDAGSTVNVGAIFKNGKFEGDGGTVSFNANALVINGNILAPGLNGGTIVTNVGNLTVGPDAVLNAVSTGIGATPGQIKLNASGKVDIPNGAVIDASGNYLGGYNANVIEISGSVVNLDGIVMANGLNGSKGGNIGIYGSEIKLGTNAQVTANGSKGGQGGAIEAIASKKFVNAGLIAANGGDGIRAVDAGEGGIVRIKSNGEATNNGIISANGGNGYNGWQPSNGGNGGVVEFEGNDVNHAGRFTANGGHGGSNPNVVRGSVVNGTQNSRGEDGGNGGQGGTIVVTHHRSINGSGSTEVMGGNGGAGQKAVADAKGAHQIAYGGNGGNAGNGGLVRFYGEPGQDILNNVNVNGGSGGQGGIASVKTDCGCAENGAAGACGGSGQVEILPKPVCVGPACGPNPPGPPATPILPLDPKQ